MGQQTITLGGGCFWCVEAVYELVDGNAGLVQWPTDQENTLVPPGHVAKFDERLQIYRTSASAAIGFLAPRAANVRNDSDPVALARWATENLMSRRKDPG